MTGFLLDTNVVSEVTKPNPDPMVIDFLSTESDLWVSTLVLHELEFGLGLLPAGRRRDRIRTQLLSFVAEYSSRVLSLGSQEARHAARFRCRRHRTGRPVNLGDALIAGTAVAHDLVLATRNVDDFDGLDVPVRNPWRSN